jgi:SpoVK/Ycf46/Vps4 family AAA+-type ATPase
MRGFHLEFYEKEFLFDFKVYGIEHDFVEHVIKAYNNTSGNFGVLLNGIRGTGKSVTAKVLANKLNLPVIIVKSMGDNNQSMIEWFADFNFDCVFLFDEFEKNFSEKDSSILQIMDGIYTSEHRRIFLLTTNQTTINENLISRPSRLRYIKEFGNLDSKVVRELLDDTLNDKSCIEDLISYIDTLKISTIDILKSVVSEVNIFGFDEFVKSKDFFNVQTATYTYRTQRAELSDSFIARNNYNIDKFLEDCKKTSAKNSINVPIRKNYATEEEYESAYQEYQEQTTGLCNAWPHTMCNIEKSFKNLKIGDLFTEHEKIVDIDYDRFVIVTRWVDYDDVYMYLVKNPDEKPSLYSTQSPNMFQFTL